MLDVRAVTKRYGDVLALDDVSLSVASGSMHGFVGRNGAGKTTTMRVALGLTEPDAGDVAWRGRPITADDRRTIGYMPEERGLYPQMSTRAQVVHFARLSGLSRTAATAAATAVVGELGLAERADDPVEKLSLGNQQRAQLAVALVASPPLLVLDEPFSGLDPVGVDALAAVLRAQVAAGTAVLFSSHQLELVEELCDVVTIIDRGGVLATGSIGELRRRMTPRRLRVSVVDGDGVPLGSAWAHGLRSVTVVADVDTAVSGRPRDAADVVVELGDGADDQAVLRAAMAAGGVRTFRHEEPSLADLFRGVVGR